MNASREELKKAVDLLPEEKLDMLYRYLRRLEKLPISKCGLKIADPARHLRGLHKDVWQGVDVDEYIRQERESWGV